VPRGLGGDWSTHDAGGADEDADAPRRTFGARPPARGGFGARGGAEGVDFQPDYSSDEDPSSHLRVGGAVHHPVFGRGNVVRLMGRGPGARAVIRFFGVGEKTLALTHAKLTPLDS
jgi:hypothetical protein